MKGSDPVLDCWCDVFAFVAFIKSSLSFGRFSLIHPKKGVDLALSLMNVEVDNVVRQLYVFRRTECSATSSSLELLFGVLSSSKLFTADNLTQCFQQSTAHGASSALAREGLISLLSVVGYR